MFSSNKIKKLKQLFVSKEKETKDSHELLSSLNRPLHSVLIICKGNICRSSYAEYRFRSLLLEESEPNIQVISAGLITTPGLPADDCAKRVAKSRGLDLSPHRTKRADPELLRSTSLILAVEQSHRKRILEHVPDVRDRLILLGALDSSPFLDIDDPYGGSDAIFHECFDRIDQALKSLLQRL